MPGDTFRGAAFPRVYPILDVDTLRARGVRVEAVAETLTDAGAEILQYRHKEFWSRETFAQAEWIRDLCRARNVLFIVNDRADAAKLLGAGLHLGQDDLPPAAARALLGPDAIIGFSTHNFAQFRTAVTEPVDYLAIGPVFGTASKRNPDPVVGLEKLPEVHKLAQLPLIAIGGVTRNNAPLVWDAGADSVAVIGDLYPVICDPESLKERMVEWRQLAATQAART